jgi:hypothetical protein
MQHQAIVAECHGGTSLGGSLPGPSTSMCHTSKPERTSVSVACAPVTDKGCSPIRPRLNSFIVYDMVRHSRRKKQSDIIPRAKKPFLRQATSLKHALSSIALT